MKRSDPITYEYPENQGGPDTWGKLVDSYRESKWLMAEAIKGANGVTNPDDLTNIEKTIRRAADEIVDFSRGEFPIG